MAHKFVGRGHSGETATNISVVMFDAVLRDQKTRSTGWWLVVWIRKSGTKRVACSSMAPLCSHESVRNADLRLCVAVLVV